MAKTSVEDLTKKTTRDLVTYLHRGTINSDQLAQTFDYSGVSIEDYSDLIDIHFVLHEDVVEYVEKLRRRLRRILTEQRPRQRTSRGEVRGSIDWGQTQALRSSVGYDDPTLFVVNDPKVELDIPENRIVKKLLDIIENTLTQDIEGQSHSWADQWDDDQIVDLQRITAQNVHLSELPDAETIEITDREISTTRRSRHELYSEGARLYRIYEDLQNERFERDEVREFLRQTIVVPSQDYKIFELFCLFGLIRKLQSQYEAIRLLPIETGQGQMAHLKSPSYSVDIYYDVGGPLTFFADYNLEELQNAETPEFVQRHATALDRQEKAAAELFERENRQSFFSGRPDFIAVIQECSNSGEEVLDEILIGEIKYTNSPSTLSTGLRELLEYLFLAKGDDGWLFHEEEQVVDMKGILCSDGVETDSDRWRYIQHWNTNDIQEFYTDPTDAEA